MNLTTIYSPYDQVHFWYKHPKYDCFVYNVWEFKTLEMDSQDVILPLN